MHSINAERLLCPLPVIRLQNKVNRLTDGEEVEIFCTDPGVLQDIPAWCRIHGHQVISTEQNDDLIRIVVKVSSSM